MRNARNLFLVPVLLGLAIAIRCHDLAKLSYSLDESSSLFYATFPEWRALFWDNHPPLYHLILKFWSALFGTREFQTRLLSVLFSSLGVLALYVTGILSGSRRRGLAAAALLTVSVLSIRFSQDTRMTSLLEFLSACLLAVWVLRLRLKNQTISNRRSTVAFTILSIASFLTHIFGLVVPALILLQQAVGDPKARKKIIAVFGLCVLTGVLYFRLSVDFRFLEWQRASFVLSSSFFGMAIEFVSEFFQADGVLATLGVGLCFLACFHQDLNQREHARWLFAFTCGVLLSAIFFSYVLARDLMMARYFAYLNPLLVWLLVLGFERMSDAIMSKRNRSFAAVIAGGVWLVFVRNAYEGGKPNWREMAEIAGRERATLVLTTKVRGLSTPYYSDQKIPVERFTYNDKFIEVLKERLKTEPRILIVDDVYSRMTYFTQLLLQLNEAGLANKTFDVTSERAEPVFGLLILRSESK